MKKSIYCFLIVCLILLLLWLPAVSLADGSWCNTEPIWETDGCLRIIPSYTYANSYIVNRQDASLWLPEHVSDNDEYTCWQFSSKDGAMGSVYLDLGISPSQAVDEIWIKNGYWNSGSGNNVYEMNCRPRQMCADFYNSCGYQDSIRFALPDDQIRLDWLRVSIPRHDDVTLVRFWVESAYIGSVYPNDVCITEIALIQYDDYYDPYPSQYWPGNESCQAGLLMKLATRSGPGLQFDEPGSFFQDNWDIVTVQVLGKYWNNDIWWVLVDFDTGHAKYRVWTGLKRVNVDIDTVPEVFPTGQGIVYPTETRRGPGGNYAKGTPITQIQDVVAFGWENGYVEIEYLNPEDNKVYRCWVPEDKAKICGPSEAVGY